MGTLGNVIAAFFVAIVATSIWQRVVWIGVRRTEYKSNQSAEAPPKNVMAWHIVHIRDDIASIAAILTLTNGLLAAVLVVLLS